MKSITVERNLDADLNSIRNLIQDIEPFMLASGFDEVDLQGDRLTVRNDLGFKVIELRLRIVEDETAVLRYEQFEGIFEEMETVYRVDSRDRGATVAATTRFALDIALIGDVLDATVIKRFRRRELNAQFDYLEAELASEA